MEAKALTAKDFERAPRKLQRPQKYPMRLKFEFSIAALAVVVLAGAVPVEAQQKCKKQTLGAWAKTVAQSYEAKSLAKLDAQRPYAGTFRVVIEHSLAGDDDSDRFVRGRFSSFARFEQWLTRREIEGFPARQVMQTFVGCSRGSCKWEATYGILHNQLYFKRLTYGMRNGCPYVKSIYLLDGD